MTPEQQRIVIAEWCGWTDIIFRGILQPHEKDYVGHHPNLTPPGSSGRWQGPLPDYLNDLNAMHEAEKRLGDPDASYALELAKLTNCPSWLPQTGMQVCRIARATAAQRAEALIRTIGKWID